MRLYVAGPMTGIPEWNFPAFDAAAEALRAAGYDVVSPAAIDRALGFDPTAPVDDFTLADYTEALRRDVAFVFEVDGVATLPGWGRSRGARAEVALAEALGKPTGPFVQFVDEAERWLA